MPVPLTSVELLERLIAFDTQSFRSNLELVAFVQDHLDGLGVASRLVHDGTGTKANLWAMVGPADVPGIVLSGHTDVVPVAGQDWTSDPFRAEIRDGRLYGRGAADMKGFLACVLALVPDLVGASLRKPAILAFSYDEEVGCKGVPGLIEALLAELPRPEACLVGEPTLMRLVDGHKGKAGYRCS
ncbi:MAG TPA: M20/M25/M40 family metallo-hydrolase, partial [Geminicoccaceae bacterium]|nr:M20/M25/M40 family metallo-hydrolase [Geminicoccaceae bacterium]